MQNNDTDQLFDTTSLSLDEVVIKDSLLLKKSQKKQDEAKIGAYIEQATSSVEEYYKVKRLEKNARNKKF